MDRGFGNDGIARLRSPWLSGGSVEQNHIQIGFRSPIGVADGGLGTLYLRGGRRETAGVIDGDEHPELIQGSLTI